jgi:hypothetical protein
MLYILLYIFLNDADVWFTIQVHSKRFSQNNNRNNSSKDTSHNGRNIYDIDGMAEICCCCLLVRWYHTKPFLNLDDHEPLPVKRSRIRMNSTDSNKCDEWIREQRQGELFPYLWYLILYAFKI